MVAVLVLSSCNKYEDGPKLSLRSKKARLANDWTMEKYLVNDVDSTSYYSAGFNNAVLTIEKDEKYSFTNAAGTVSGTWELGEDKDDIRMQQTAPTVGSGEDSYRILRLKEKELWLRHTESNGTTVIIHWKGK